MRFCFVAFIALLGLALTTGPVQAQISVSIPNETGVTPGQPIDIEVAVETPINEEDGIVSYEFEIQYDPDLLTINGVEPDGTLSEDVSLSVNFEEPGIARVAVANETPIFGGPAPLVKLEADINGGVSGISPLSFVEFQFNETPLDAPPPATIATSGSISINTSPPTSSNLIINEIHPTPATDDDCGNFGKPSDCGDANNDGEPVASEDQFVEIINTGEASIDLSGYTVSNNQGVIHTFEEGTMLNGGVAATVFGGGNPTGIPGLVLTANSLELNDEGDTVILSDDAGNVVTAVLYSDRAIVGQSATRNPDKGGPFQWHSDASNDGELYSPGRTINGGDLPVELRSFDAVLDGRDVVLQWSTASETNNSGFNVQQRVDGTFENLTFVEGAGHATSTEHYSHRVSGLEPGTYVFRLEQVDADGATTLSPEVEVSVPVESAFVLESAYPNPFQTQATFTLRVRETQDVTVTLFNALGQRVRNIFAGTVRADVPETFTIDGASLPSGMYLYRVQGRTFSASKQITRVK